MLKYLSFKQSLPLICPPPPQYCPVSPSCICQLRALVISHSFCSPVLHHGSILTKVCLDFDIVKINDWMSVLILLDSQQHRAVVCLSLLLKCIFPGLPEYAPPGFLLPPGPLLDVDGTCWSSVSLGSKPPSSALSLLESPPPQPLVGLLLSSIQTSSKQNEVSKCKPELKAFVHSFPNYQLHDYYWLSLTSPISWWISVYGCPGVNHLYSMVLVRR